MSAEGLFWAPRAWVDGAWANAVLLRVDARGHWAQVSPDTPPPLSFADAQLLPGPVLPSLVNAHSHAFQRAFVGLAERRDSAQDDFWSWRDRMYRVALRITPAQLQAVATQLYAELLAGGYTQVCEFHYLHHAEDGKAYADEAAMSRALAAAAQTCGMGLTLLPVLYQRAGFQQPELRADQRRFAADVARVLRLRDAVRSWNLPNVSAGVAIHSLRAASAGSVRDLVLQLRGDPGPLHIHIAEQTGEVSDCLAATGARPIEWLARELPLDARWQLVHATHATPEEIRAVAASGAGVVLCPGTEANLGDGLADLPRWLAAGVPLSLGSDSHVTRNWPEELRWLEYGQRLLLRQRNVAAAPGSRPGSRSDSRPGSEPSSEPGSEPASEPSTAARLFERMRAGGATAAGFAQWGLVVGARADLLVLDAAQSALCGLPPTHLLDGLVFGAPERPFSMVMVAGRWVDAANKPTPGFRAAMQALWPQPTA